MARAGEAYKRFLGSSFLSDFTLIICGESYVSAGELPPHDDSNSSAATSSAEQQPGTPDNNSLSLNPESEDAPASTASATAADVSGAHATSASSTATAASTSRDAADAAIAVSVSQDEPCSGQHHHFPADILPQSPHRSAASAGVGPLSAAALQTTSTSLPGHQQQDSAPAAGGVSTGHSGNSGSSSLKPLVTHSAAAAATAAAAQPTHGRLSKQSSCVADSGSGVIVMPVHGVVLAAASPYFETLLRDWACNHQQLQMVVGDDQLPAAQQLLSYIYTGSLAPGLPQSDLLQLLLLADRFDTERAVTAARRALASLSPECFEWATLSGVWGLPQHLYEGEGDEAAALRGVAWERLLQLFGDLEEAWASADGRAMWQQLPWRALSALVASDALAVASENTTFAAVSSWIAHQQHQQHLLMQQMPGSSQQLRPTPQELQQLAAAIRIPALGPCYLSYVCLQQEWFASAVDVVSLARAAAFAAAAPEVRKDLAEFTATSTAAAMTAAAAAAAAAAAPIAGGYRGSGSSAAGGSDAVAAAVVGGGGAECIVGSSSLGVWGPGVGGVGMHHHRCSSCGGGIIPQHGSSLATAAGGGCGSSAACGSSGGGGSSGSGGGCGGSSAIEHRMQLMSLAQAMQRPRNVSTKRAGQFSWRVDLAAIRQLYDDVAAAGSRDSRILRSPAHSFAGYEWALQLEVTQTRGATGFDVTKPWSLGVFLTCQVRLEQPAHSSSGSSGSQQQNTATGMPLSTSSAASTVPQGGLVAAASAAAAGGGDTDAGTRRISSSSSGSGVGGNALGAGGSSSSAVGRAGSPAAGGAVGGSGGSQQQQQQLVMQLVDFGFVSTSATIAVREAGSSANKRTEKSWEHAVVRYRASWGWPNYLDAQAVGWDESMFLRWLIDGQLQLSARVRVLG